MSNKSRATIDDRTLIQTFVENCIQGESIVLPNPNLKAETVGDTIQLVVKTEGIVVTAYLIERPRTVLINRSSRYWELIHQAMFANSFFPIGNIQKEGIYRYQYRPMPENYQMHCTSALELWKVWSGQPNRNYRTIMTTDFIMLKQGAWSSIKDVIDGQDTTLYIKTATSKVSIKSSDMLIWGKKVK